MLFNVTGLTVEVSQYFKLISMWAATMHICMCSIHILKGGGEDSPPWPYVEKTLINFEIFGLSCAYTHHTNIPMDDMI